MKTSELRNTASDPLPPLDRKLRDQLIRLSVLKATQRSTNTAKFSEIRRDIARIKTIAHERKAGVDGKQA